MFLFRRGDHRSAPPRLGRRQESQGVQVRTMRQEPELARPTTPLEQPPVRLHVRDARLQETVVAAYQLAGQNDATSRFSLPERAPATSGSFRGYTVMRGYGLRDEEDDYDVAQPAASRCRQLQSTQGVLFSLIVAFGSANAHDAQGVRQLTAQLNALLDGPRWPQEWNDAQPQLWKAVASCVALFATDEETLTALLSCFCGLSTLPADPEVSQPMLEVVSLYAKTKNQLIVVLAFQALRLLCARHQLNVSLLYKVGAVCIPVCAAEFSQVATLDFQLASTRLLNSILVLPRNAERVVDLGLHVAIFSNLKQDEGWAHVSEKLASRMIATIAKLMDFKRCSTVLLRDGVVGVLGVVLVDDFPSSKAVWQLGVHALEDLVHSVIVAEAKECEVACITLIRGLEQPLDFDVYASCAKTLTALAPGHGPLLTELGIVAAVKKNLQAVATKRPCPIAIVAELLEALLTEGVDLAIVRAMPVLFEMLYSIRTEAVGKRVLAVVGGMVEREPESHSQADLLAHLKCPICTEELCDPVVSQPCCHTFCSLCVRQWLFEGNPVETPHILGRVRQTHCPVCRQVVHLVVDAERAEQLLTELENIYAVPKRVPEVRGVRRPWKIAR